MVRQIVRTQRTIYNTSCDDVYTILNDYRSNHIDILVSTNYFDDVKIIKGYGIGEGTRIQKTYTMNNNINHGSRCCCHYCYRCRCCRNYCRLLSNNSFWCLRLGRRQYKQQQYVIVLDISEPEPGRILQEIEAYSASTIIRYIIDPIIVSEQDRNQPNQQIEQNDNHQHQIDLTINTTATTNSEKSSSDLSNSDNVSKTTTTTNNNGCIVTIEIMLMNKFGFFGIIEMLYERYFMYRMYTQVLIELDKYINDTHTKVSSLLLPVVPSLDNV